MNVTFVLDTSRQRGAAYLEALLVVTFCSVVWAAVVSTGRLHVARQQARSQARSCAWSVAVAGCQEIPAQCGGAGAARGPSSPRLQEKFSRAVSGVASEAADDDAGGVASSREAVEAAIEGLFFERISAKGSRQVRRPVRWGGETVEVRETYSLPCNSRPSSAPRHAHDAFAKILARGQR